MGVKQRILTHQTDFALISKVLSVGDVILYGVPAWT
jgi:hypothetical protein